MLAKFSVFYILSGFASLSRRVVWSLSGLLLCAGRGWVRCCSILCRSGSRSTRSPLSLTRPTSTDPIRKESENSGSNRTLWADCVIARVRTVVKIEKIWFFSSGRFELKFSGKMQSCKDFSKLYLVPRYFFYKTEKYRFCGIVFLA